MLIDDIKVVVYLVLCYCVIINFSVEFMGVILDKVVDYLFENVFDC